MTKRKQAKQGPTAEEMIHGKAVAAGRAEMMAEAKAKFGAHLAKAEASTAAMVSTKPQHTPGPWFWDDFTQGPKNNLAAAVVTQQPNRRFLAEIHAEAGNIEAEREALANARLIAAAPDLKALAEFVGPRFERLSRHLTPKEQREFSALIAIVRGES